MRYIVDQSPAVANTTTGGEEASDGVTVVLGEETVSGFFHAATVSRDSTTALTANEAHLVPTGFRVTDATTGVLVDRSSTTGWWDFTVVQGLGHNIIVKYLYNLTATATADLAAGLFNSSIPFEESDLDADTP